MSKEIFSEHPVAVRRKARGWSQAELAERAGIPRTTLSAIESRRLTPAVTAALAVARAFECRVEDLFGAPGGGSEWAWEPTGDGMRYHEALVGGRRLSYPVESIAVNAFPHDGVRRSARDALGDGSLAADTLVVACCDPAAGILAGELSRTSGVRLLMIERGGLAALDLLRRGLVHAAGLHFSTAEDSDRNRQIVLREVGSGYHLLRAAAWQEGIALAHPDRFDTTESLLRRCDAWALREPGSAARDCFDGLLGGRRQPKGRIVGGHASVAGSIRAGWADAGVCVRLSAEEAGLAFRPVREEYLDLCVSDASLGDRRVRALLQVLRSREHRRLIDDLPGYDAIETGAILSC